MVDDSDDETYNTISIREIQNAVANVCSDPWHNSGAHLKHYEMENLSFKKDGLAVFSTELFDFDTLPINFLRKNLYDRELGPNVGLLNQSKDLWKPHFNDRLTGATRARTPTNRWQSVMNKNYFNKTLEKKVNLCIIVLLCLICANKTTMLKNACLLISLKSIVQR